ncbi:hypothetical protein QBC47DRAFT_401369 [Echria macrotheca]|uniref:Uncharacterized protein n=1 Tax=Echria macrotheca TaxID=438768 RepID=A0AAJ0BEE5_9PEZI|nr:hypothetical protein QBC47DRAFT_401369 [Echria macrotheca]
MEDEEFYHLMIQDLDRLERVHHHIEPPPPPEDIPHSHPHTTTRRRRLSAVLSERTIHSPWVSGIRTALGDAVRAGIEAVAQRVISSRVGDVGVGVGVLSLPPAGAAGVGGRKAPEFEGTGRVVGLGMGL